MGTLRFRPRHVDEPERSAHVGETVRLQENGSYYLWLDEDLSASETLALEGVGFEVLDSRRVLLSFGNYVGTTAIRGVSFSVESRKLGSNGASALLQEAVELAAELIYGWNAPLAFGVSRRGASNRRVAFHDFMYLRREMLVAEVGHRVQDYFEAVAEQPTRRLDASLREVPVSRVQRVDRRGWTGLLTAPSRLARLAPDSPFYDFAVARALSQPGTVTEARYMPTAVLTPTRVVSFDTPENRFIRHFLQTCGALIGRFLEHPKLHLGLRADARRMGMLVDEMSRAAFLEGVGQPSSLASPSQAILKLEGYRQIFDCYRALLDAPTTPQSDSECQRFLDGRDVATLYEYWTFLQVCSAVASVLGVGVPSVPVDTTDLGALLGRGLCVRFSGGVAVTYNQGFPGNSVMGSYSTALRPDVTLLVPGREFVFDAKYRLDGLAIEENADDIDDELTWKQADLHKMHTYRDAIARVPAAFVMYPGDVFVFYESSVGRRREPEEIGALDGVGAIPMRPGVPADQDRLRSLIRRVVTSPGAPSTTP